MQQRDKAYRESGVDIGAGNAFVSSIRSIVSETFTKGVITEIGGFGGLFKPDLQTMREPVLVSATDGVGTKLKLACMFDSHRTIGIDLVAMSVNDVLVQGARPLFFLDYFATGRLEPNRAQDVIRGIATGCKQAECSLLGGETAEMPDFYAPGEYDLSGFCVGLVDNNRIVDGSGIRVGDRIVGMASSGIHSNGYSLVRKILQDSGLKGSDMFPGTDRTVAEVLLEPTTIYVKTVLNLLRDLDIRGMVHITGGGFYDNIPRVLPESVKATVQFGTWDIPPVFPWLRKQGNLSWEEMFQIFNSGIGYLLIISQDIEEDVMSRLKALGQSAWVIGEIAERTDQDSEQVDIFF